LAMLRHALIQPFGAPADAALFGRRRQPESRPTSRRPRSGA
jgi:hypothetical protein